MTPAIRAWTAQAVREALGIPPVPGVDGARAFSMVSTDTRTLRSGALFVALRGERHDAHEFLFEAVRAGATGLVVEGRTPSDAIPPGVELFPVQDTLLALGALAHARRRAWGDRGLRVIAIGGSAGKTTTKEMVRAVLDRRFRVHATAGNRNNRVGLPLTILEAEAAPEVLVLEIGTNLPGEVALLAAIAEPQVAIITNVGAEHLEGLGSLAGVLAEECALAAAVADGGTVFVGSEPPELAACARALHPDVRVAGWSEAAEAGLQPLDPSVDASGCWSFSWRGHRIRLGIPGRHMVENALLALGVSDRFGIAPGEAAEALAAVGPVPLRGEIRSFGGLSVLVDCYNANPPSTRAGLATLASMEAPGGRIAVLGSMLELGEAAGSLHDELLAEALAGPFRMVVAVGLFAEAAARIPPGARPAAGATLLTVRDADEARERLPALLEGGEVVLLKGSRGVALERVLPSFAARFGDGAHSGSVPTGGS